MAFIKPSKKIFDSSDLSSFKRSIGYRNIHDSISQILNIVRSYDVPRRELNLGLVDRRNGTQDGSKRVEGPKAVDIQYDPNTLVVIQLLVELAAIVDEIKPLEGPRRFGNFAFKDWYKIMETTALERLKKLTVKGVDTSVFVMELNYYFSSSFGSNIRLDYGTGHELSFVAFIGSLLKYDVIQASNQQLLVVFAKYYDLVRKLILTYTLEPAGSHGVWGLDDHFHFIYILGAAQFNDPVSKYAPAVKECLNDTVINEFMGTNLYINALAFIKKIKSGPFNEHSPILFDIHNSVTLWKKVLSGLLKMYDVEVLGKFPVVQHFWFGGVLYPWKDENSMDLPVNPLSNEEFLDGSGVNTTGSNVSMTGAPWTGQTRMSMQNLPQTARPGRPQTGTAPITGTTRPGRPQTIPGTGTTRPGQMERGQRGFQPQKPERFPSPR